MRLRLVRSLLICLTILGILAPRISAVAALAAPHADVLVICTGKGLVTLRLDADGNPVPLGEPQPDHCVLAHAADTAVRVEAPPVRMEPAPAPPRPSAGLVLLSDAQAARPPPRAPPAA